MADRTAILSVLVTMAIAAFLGAQVAGMDINQERLDENREAFAEYCAAEFGDDADVYRANDAFSSEHNGLHCDHNDGTVHRTQIPQEVWDAYMAGEVSADYVTSELEAPPGILPIPRSPVIVGAVGPILLFAIIIWGLQGGIPPRF